MKYTSLLFTLPFLLGAKQVNAQQPSWLSLSTQEVQLDTATAFSLFVADFNNDHYPDLAVVKGGWNAHAENNMRLYLNIQDTASADPLSRIFIDITSGSGMNSMPTEKEVSKGTLTAAFADVNNDGHIDMVRGSYYHADPTKAPDVRCEVLLGDGKGHFKIVPGNGLHELGLTNTTGFSFLDYDKDGKLDLFIARWFIDYGADQWQPGVLMKGNGDGTFTDVSIAAGITKPEPMFGCAVTDWNNDGWPDIATAPYCRTGGQLWRNNGDGTFTDVAREVGYNAQFMQGDNGQNLCLFGSAPEDFDNDGDIDFMFNLVHGGSDPKEGHSTIVSNSGPDSGYRLKWDLNAITWKKPKSSHQGDYDVAWLDVDNDGLMDMALAQGTYMPATDRLFVFHQQKDHSFMDITQEVGLIIPETKDMHHLEALDFDLDGDDDLVIARVGASSPIEFIKNKIGQDNNWLGVRLNAPSTVNKSSIGARIHLWAGGVHKMREVYAGRGNNAGQQPFALLFGLGDIDYIDSVKVTWPEAGNNATVMLKPTINTYIELGPDMNSPASIHSVTINIPSKLKAYPNPCADFILIQMEDNSLIEMAEVYDISGKKVWSTTYTNKQTTHFVSVKTLPSGSYIIKTTNRDGRLATSMFTKL